MADGTTRKSREANSILMDSSEERTIKRLKGEIAELRRRNAQLRREVAELQQRIVELEAERNRAKDRRLPRIGEILIDMGYATRMQLEVCLIKQQQTKGKLLGEIMVESGVITTDQLLQALAEQLKMMSPSK